MRIASEMSFPIADVVVVFVILKVLSSNNVETKTTGGREGEMFEVSTNSRNGFLLIPNEEGGMEG